MTNQRKIDVKNGRGRRLMEFLLELAHILDVDCSHRHYYCCVGNQ